MLVGNSSSSGEWSRQNVNGSIHPSVLIIGLGNPILGDDGVGWRVAEQVEQELSAWRTSQEDN